MKFLMKLRATTLAMTVLLVALTFALTACGRNNDQNEDGELTIVNVNEVVRSVFYAPFYAAIELGFFADEGLEIALETGQGADRSMVALISGDADIGLMGTEAAIGWCQYRTKHFYVKFVL